MPPFDADPQTDFAALLERHRKIVFKVSNSYAWNADDRAELAQEIATQLWSAFANYDRSRPFSTWMYRIALNVAISFARAHEQRRRYLTDVDELSELAAADSGHGPEQASTLALLDRVLAALDPFSRALLVLHLEEHSNREIGDILGLTETNVSTKLSRLKQRLRERLEPSTPRSNQ